LSAIKSKGVFNAPEVNRVFELTKKNYKLNFETKVGGYKEDNLRRMCCVAIDKNNKIVPYPSAIEYPPVMLPICNLFDSGGSDFYGDYNASTN
jgi:hypothetical protein